MSDLDALARALAQAPAIDEWIATGDIARTVRVERRGSGRPEIAAIERAELAGDIYRDLRDGRGQARVAPLGAGDAELAGAIARARELAEMALGPSWRLPPPAAPARVELADPALAAPDAAARLDAAITDAARAAGVELRNSVARVTRSTHAVATSTGFRGEFAATLAEVRAVVAGEGASETVWLAGRTADLELTALLADAAARLADRRRARPITPGRYDVVLRGPALTGPAPEDALDRAPARFGWLAPLVAHADATLARRGSTRYLPGQPVHPAARDAADPLTVISDGTVPFGLLSRPFGDAGEPVRRFPLVTSGVAAGLALDLREAALRQTSPNGGVRNLRVEPGSLAPAQIATPGERPVLEVVQLAWLAVTPAAGEVCAEIALAHVDGLPVTGGLIRGNALAGLVSARRSRDRISRGWYVGPSAWRLQDVAIV